jgi:hypothetical protein
VAVGDRKAGTFHPPPDFEVKTLKMRGIAKYKFKVSSLFFPLPNIPGQVKKSNFNRLSLSLSALL